METLFKARDILEKVEDEVESNKDRDIPCTVITEDGFEMNTEDLWSAYANLDDALSG